MKMADNNALEFDGEQDDKENKGKKGLVVIIAVLLLAGAGAALYFSGMLDSVLKKEEMAEAVAEEATKSSDAPAASKKVPLDVVYYELPHIMANLNPGSATPSFIKTTITIEAPNQEVVTRLQAIQPKVMDVINTYVRELRPSDLKGSAGIQRLREEIMMRINKTLDPDKVNNVLFKEILIQ
jgi:flagellar protein FliL